jgi:phenylacetate-CoA ligase
MKIKVELGREGGDISELKGAIESLLRAKLIFKPDVELVPAGSLPKYEYKSRLVDKTYEKK